MPPRESDQLLQRSVHAALWNYAGAVARIFFQFGIQVILARLLGPHVYGQFALVMALIGFGWLVSEGGVGVALIQTKRLQAQDVEVALGWILVCGLLVGSTLSLSSSILATWLGEPGLAALLWVVGPIVCLQALANIPLSLMRRDLRAKDLQIIQVGSYVAGFGGVGLWMAWRGDGVWSLIAAFATQSVLTLLLAYAHTKHSLRPRLRGSAGLVRLGVKVMLTNIVNWAGDNVDRVLIGRQWGLTSLGGYSAAGNLARMPVTVMVGSLQAVLLAAASQVQEHRQKLQSTYVSVLSLSLLVGMPAFAIVSLFSVEIVGLIYGEKWMQAAPFLAALAAACPFLIVTYITGPLLCAIDCVEVELATQLLGVVAMVTALLSLSTWSIETVVWVMPAVAAFKGLTLLYFLVRKIGLKPARLLKSLRGGAALTLVVCGTTLGLAGIRSNHPLGSLMVVIAAAVVVSFALVQYIVSDEVRQHLRVSAARYPALQRLFGSPTAVQGEQG